MAELKPCPFCGRKAELRYTEEGFSYIVCANDGCYVRTDGHLNEESAINHWNKRTSQKDAEIEILTGERDYLAKKEHDNLYEQTQKIRKAKSKAQEDFANKVYKFLCNWKNWGDFKEQWLENGECFWLRHNLDILLKEETN